MAKQDRSDCSYRDRCYFVKAVLSLQRLYKEELFTLASQNSLKWSDIRFGHRRGVMRQLETNINDLTDLVSSLDPDLLTMTILQSEV